MAYRAPDLFGMLIAAGITIMISLQAIINIAVVTGVIPNKGLPLPLISYGGSNLVITMAGIGLLLNICRKGQDSLLNSATDVSLEPLSAG